jgi:hypothetical protein
LSWRECAFSPNLEAFVPGPPTLFLERHRFFLRWLCRSRETSRQSDVRFTIVRVFWQVWQQHRPFSLLLFVAHSANSLRCSKSSGIETSPDALPASSAPLPLTQTRHAENFSLDHLVGAQQERLRYYQSERLGGLEIDDESRTSSAAPPVCPLAWCP